MGVLAPSSDAVAETALASGLCVVNFFATWCEPCEHMNTVFAELSNELPALSFIQLDADMFPDMCERFSLESVPAFLFTTAGKQLDLLLGADAPELVARTRKHALTASISAEMPPAEPGTGSLSVVDASPPIEQRLHGLVRKAPLMLFMKGNPDAPRCGFSRQIVEILNGEGAKFDTFDILGDEEVRQALKTYSNWPTYPQLYADGELLGGLDIVKELKEEGELKESLPAAVFA